MKVAAFTHLLLWWLEELIDATLRGVWIRIGDARRGGDLDRAATLLGRFHGLVGRHDWFPCRIEYYTDECPQLIVTAGPRVDFSDDIFDQEEFA